MSTDSGTYIGIGSFVAFAISVIAAVIAIDMYKLLRTGEFGASWRILIIATVIFSFMQALRMAELFDWGGLREQHLSEIADLIFVGALAYAFYLQRRVFTHAFKTKSEAVGAFTQEDDDDLPLSDALDVDDAPTGDINEEASREIEWARLSGRYLTDVKTTARH